MLPLTPHTERFVTAELVDLLPRGALVVLVTRAQIIDMDAVRRRVLADEIALASDVFDPEPVPLDDPLLGRDNVVHTPHNAGRTIDANQAFTDELLDQFRSDH
jgi:phosphoglycerate dehydrogenase-like enzyme